MHEDERDLPDGSPAGAGEQRSGSRFNLLIRPAKLAFADGQEFLCVLRDVSPGGCKARLFHELPEEGPVTLELGNGDRYPVERVWEREEHIGLRFREAVPVEYLLNEEGRFRKRPVRVRLAIAATLVAGREEIPVELRDLSQQGAQLGCDVQLAVDQQVRLEIPGLAPIVSKVRWRRAAGIGLVFEQTFRLDEFARLIARLQARGVAGPDSRCA
ncbi:PilZ domain-containing protein [Novosphingobium flavum]|uniref:PilZ domain-containing protein n=1 Tax=Novosphingobium flavum TaxID=1778672 RepID=A0A7X1FQN8_9SPHN|nr:PilZ domain-containing protein [Novosphingobium flavum]MBC2664642.1 PilZ domain-containing protein [Novosphingobium flavum]